MSIRSRSLVALAAFVLASLGILSACDAGSTAPHALIKGARAVKDSADTTACPYGWTSTNGVISCTDGGH